MSPIVTPAVYGNPPVTSFPAEPDPERIFDSYAMVGVETISLDTFNGREVPYPSSTRPRKPNGGEVPYATEPKWKHYVLTPAMSPIVTPAVNGNLLVTSFPAVPDPERNTSRLDSI